MSMDSMKKYRLAVDENGSPFVLNSKGSINFGYITEEMKNDSYGLNHMIKNHYDQLSECGFSDVSSFVEFVSQNFNTIKEGHTGTYLLEVNEVRNHTLFIALSKSSEYWKVISGGVFRIQYSRNKKKVYSVPAIRMPEPVSQAKVPAPENNQQASSEASGDSL